MGNKKTVFKFFTIPQYQQEEKFLSEMHENGWCFAHVSFPGFYHFENVNQNKCHTDWITIRKVYEIKGNMFKCFPIVVGSILRIL